MDIPIIYYSQEESSHSGVMVLNNFALEAPKHFGTKKSYKKH